MDDWAQVSRYVLEALQTLTRAVEEFRKETSKFSIEAASKFVLMEQNAAIVKSLEAEIDRLRADHAEYRIQAENRITRIETKAGIIAALISLVVGSIVSTVIDKLTH